VIDWLFRNRETGRVTIVQAPNAPLLIFVVASGMRRLLNISGAFNAALLVVAVVALLYWGVLELVQGVNPWRRALGGGVIAWQLVSLALHR
jgi:Mn2+/Fe2+ NRAMP family transporter